MTSTDNLIKKLATLTTELANTESVEKLILFGSFARGTQTITSDVDLAIIFIGKLTNNARATFREIISNFEEKHNFEYDIQPTYVTLDNYLTDEHLLNVSSSIRKDGIVLWQK